MRRLCEGAVRSGFSSIDHGLQVGALGGVEDRRGPPKRRVQETDEASDSPAAVRGLRIAPQNLRQDRRGQGSRLGDPRGSDGGIFAFAELEGAGGVSRGGQDMLDLRSLRQGMEEGGSGGVRGRAGGLACGGSSCVAGLLSRAMRRPGDVSERLGPLGAVREGLRGVERLSRAPIVRAFALADREGWPRASRRIAGDRPEFGAAEFDRHDAARAQEGVFGAGGFPGSAAFPSTGSSRGTP